MKSAVGLVAALCLAGGKAFAQAPADDPANVADFILLGERHGTEDQQIMAAAVLLEVAKSGRNVGVIMEMIGADQAELLETFRKLSPQSSADFGPAIGWHKTNWPDYKYYAPIIDVIWARDMALAPGDPPKADLARWRRGKFRADEFDPHGVLSRRISIDAADGIKASWMSSVQKSHCDQLSETEAGTVARLQMMRDAFMAEQMRAMKAAGADVVVLIAGRAHTRRDRGVPVYLGEYADTQSIAIVETDPDEAGGEDYQPDPALPDRLPYDHIVLTAPIKQTESTCERLRRKGLIR